MTVAPESRDADVVLSIVIPTHNRSDVLSRTLQGLAGQSVTVPWEVIVVNNRCEDETDRVVAAMATTFPCDLRLVHEDMPGASAARNHGVRSARGSVLVLLDDEIFLRDGQLARALADHRRRPDMVHRPDRALA